MYAVSESDRHNLAAKLIGSLRRGSCLCDTCATRFDNFADRLLQVLAPGIDDHEEHPKTRKKGRRCSCEIYRS